MILLPNLGIVWQNLLNCVIDLAQVQDSSCPSEIPAGSNLEMLFPSWPAVLHLTFEVEVHHGVVAQMDFFTGVHHFNQTISRPNSDG
jgi:hypothetical protein